MAFDNFDNLKASLISWSRRADMSTFIGDAVTICESHIYTGAGGLRTRAMETEVIQVVNTKSIAFPSSCLEIRNISIEIDGSYCRMIKGTIQTTPDNPDITGAPSTYAITSLIEFNVLPDKDYNVKIEYYQRPAPLSDDEPTNSTLDSYPTVYFYGSMAAVYEYAGELEMITYWGNMFKAAVHDANIEEYRLGLGSLPTIININGGVP
mgnify:CR=1 FL=1